jgi:hypothetical protein
MTDEQIEKLIVTKEELRRLMVVEFALYEKASPIRNAKSVEESLRVQRESKEPCVMAYRAAAKRSQALAQHYRVLQIHYAANPDSRHGLPVQSGLS